ncbi:hypothetical protein GCM10023321_37460 [Pseudonocardia eucalypti]|uniref:Uncharacterized protein n=1 Tax=Pseudonocardia eucalypti TaxID=648755 RepID=A0ABP9Q7N1_9PSEU|nr:hypothetical protein [Pseudonocardia eucalypti]
MPTVWLIAGRHDQHALRAIVSNGMRPILRRHDRHSTGALKYLAPTFGTIAFVPMQRPLIMVDNSYNFATLCMVVVAPNLTGTYLRNVQVMHATDATEVLAEQREAKTSMVGGLVEWNYFHLFVAQHRPRRSIAYRYLWATALHRTASIARRLVLSPNNFE